MSLRSADVLLSNNEKQFILKAIEDEHRIDGRRPYDYRKIQFQLWLSSKSKVVTTLRVAQFALDGSSCTVILGQTRALTAVSAVLEAPRPERPNEGSLRFTVDLSPMASPAFEASYSGEDSAEVLRLLERGIRDIRAVDLEALCVLPGRKVWRLQLDVRVLDHAGNMLDAVFLSALAALMAFRRPEVSIQAAPDATQSALVVHSIDEREALPLSLHQVPLAVSFALFKDGNSVLVDPSLEEEAAAAGTLTAVLNSHSEVCAIHKSGGIGLSLPQVLRVVRIASVKVTEITEHLKAALAAHTAARVAARVRRREPMANPASQSLRSVAVLSSADISGDTEVMDIDRETAALEAAVEHAESSSSKGEEERENLADVMDVSSATAGMESWPSAPLLKQEGRPVMRGNKGTASADPRMESEENGPSSAQDHATRQQDTAALRTLVKDEPVDEYERIAALIAGSGSMGAGKQDLQTAVKKKKSKSKKTL